MKSRARILATALVALLASGCKEVQLAGSVADAEVVVDLLNQPGASYQKLRTTDRGDVIRQFGLPKWNTMKDQEKLFWVGNFEVDEALVDPQSLYLVTARYGEDVDADRDRRYDSFPRAVEGQWRAIMSGEALLANANIVSALTEAAYQYVRSDINLISDEALLARLDEFARRVVSDIDGDGDVDYLDVLRWSRFWYAEQYLGDIALLDNLAEVITTDRAEYIRYAAAASVWRNEVVNPVRPGDVAGTNVGGTVSGDIAWTRDGSPYNVTASLTVDGNLSIEAGVEVRGFGRVITVTGDLTVDGVPRQPAVLDNVVFSVSSFGPGAESHIRYANLKDGRMIAKIQQFTMEQSSADDWQLEIRTITSADGNRATIRQNVFEDSTIVFYNRSPARDLFRVDFINNLFIAASYPDSELVTKWEAPVANLKVENNSFHPEMRVLRSGSNPVLDVRNNYWGVDSSADIDFDEVIPDNGGESPYPYIPYLPRLRSPHPETPVAL
jgi:hypothetical protein